MHDSPNALMARLNHHANHAPQRIALSDGEQHLSYTAVIQDRKAHV